MKLATKGLLSVFAGISLATGGSFLTKKVMKDNEIRRYKAKVLGDLEAITFRFLAHESDSLTKYKDKYAESYLWYLISNETSVDAWWTWAFQHEYPQITEEKYGFQVGSAEELKTACQKAYEGTRNNSGEITVSGEDAQNTKYLETHIWRLCSPIHQKIETIGEDSSDTSKYKTEGEEAETYGSKYKDKLVSVKSESLGNQEFWLDKEHAYLYYTKSSETPNPKNLSIKRKCKEAYESKVQDNNAFSSKLLFIFCSLKGYE